MDGYQLQSSLLDYDPEEEERKRTAAFAALAAQSTPEDSAMSPGELQLEQPDVVLPEPDISHMRMAVAENDPDPAEVPGAVPELPDPGVEGRAFSALAAQRAPEQPPTPEATPPGAQPANGLDSAGKSPQMKELTNPTQGTSKVEPPPAPDPFEALMLRGEEQRQKQLAQYDEQGAPGVNGWALLADVAFNKGRSIPGILQQVDNDKRHYQEGRQKLLTGGGAHNDPVSQMLAMERVKVAQGREGRLGENDEAKRARLEGAAAQDKTSADGMRKYAKDNGFWTEAMEGMSFKDLMGMKGFLRTDQDHANAPRIAEDKANERTATTHAENVADYNDRGIKADVAGEIRGAQVDEELRALPNRAQTPDQIAADALQREGLEESKRSRRVAEGARADTAATHKEDKNRSWVTEYGNKHIKQIDTASLLDELDDVIAAAERDKKLPPGLGVEQLKEGADKYPLGQTLRGIAGLVGDDEYNKFQSEADYNKKLIGRLGESVYRIDTGASGNEREEMRAAIASALSPFATLADIKNSTKILRTRLTSQLGNAAAAAPDLAAQSLTGGGIRDTNRWLGHLRKSAPPPTAAPPADDFADDVDALPTDGPGSVQVPDEPGHTLPNLATNGQRGKSLPKPADVSQPQPTAASPNSATQHVTIYYTDGTSEEDDVPVDQIPRLRGRRGVKEVR